MKKNKEGGIQRERGVDRMGERLRFGMITKQRTLSSAKPRTKVGCRM